MGWRMVIAMKNARVTVTQSWWLLSSALTALTTPIHRRPHNNRPHQIMGRGLQKLIGVSFCNKRSRLLLVSRAHARSIAAAAANTATAAQPGHCYLLWPLCHRACEQQRSPVYPPLATNRDVQPLLLRMQPPALPMNRERTMLLLLHSTDKPNRQTPRKCKPQTTTVCR